jgi:hypothetical protein
MTADKFIEYLKEQVANGSIYVWGAQGQKAPTICEKWIRRMEKATGGTEINGHYETYAAIAVTAWAHKVEKGYGEVLRAFDCSGLGVYFFLKHKLIKYDMNANALMRLCEAAEKPEKGYWVFRTDQRGRATHIGYMISDKELVEAKGRAYGVVTTKYKKSDWNFVGKPKIFDFEPEPPAPTEKQIKVKGNVNVRKGNGPEYAKIGTARNELLPYLGQAEEEPYWYETKFEGSRGYITSNKRYTEVIGG